MGVILPGREEIGAAGGRGPGEEDSGLPVVPVAPVVRPRSVFAVILMVFGTLLVLALGYLAWRAITSFLIAVLLAMALNPAVARLERKGLGRGSATASVVGAAFVIIGAIGFLIIPPLVSQVVGFADDVPDLIRQLDRGSGPLGFIERRTGIVDRLQAAVDENGAGALFGIGPPVLEVAKTVATAIFAAVAVTFLTLFLLLDGRRWLEMFLDVLPHSARPRWERVFAGIYRTVGGYVTGNLLISLICGLVSGVTLAVLGVPYAVPLALLAAILDLIPLVGAITATVVLGLAALTQGIVPAAVVVVVLLVYQQIENHLLQPYIYGRAVRLSGLAVLVSVLIGAELAGVLGALAAIPVGGTIQVVATELLRWRRDTSIEIPARALHQDEASGALLSRD
jgi:predicted PurR-regulated permease PerM